MTEHDTRTHVSTDAAQNRGRRPLGLPLIALIALALLAVPRVILHDLDLIQSGTLVNALFVFVPPIVWVVVVLLRRVPRPFLALLIVGIVYGVLLAAGHQVLWGVSSGENSPRLGGNLASLDPGVQEVIFRSFAAVSSLITGTVVGAIAGVVAWGLQKLIRRTRPGA